MILASYKTTTTNPANINSAILTVFSQVNDGATQEVHGTIRITNRSSSALTNLTVVIDKPTRYGEQTVQVNGVSSIEIPLSPILWRAGETLSVSVLSDNAGDNATTVVCDFFIESAAPTDFLTPAAIASNAITAAKIADNAITNAKLADGAISVGKIADNSITAAKIASDAITAAKIATDAITAAKIADNAITDAKINAGAITATKLADGTITAAKIATDAITDAKIANNAFTAAKFAAASLNDKGNWNVGKTGYALSNDGRNAIISDVRADIERTGGMLDTVPTLSEIEASDVLAKSTEIDNAEANLADYINAVSDELAKVPRANEALVPGQYRLEIEGGQAANVTIGAPV
jgi:hypothetical protein